MPILTLQRSMRRLGRIRMGAKTDTIRPKKLETWRMTSPARDLLEAAAEMYGGTVGEWAGSPSGKQWELFTEADALEVVIPPGDMAFSQWFEMWSGGGCQRRCDGQQEQLSGEPCQCPADPDARLELAGKGKACKPTTRLFVIQPRLPDVGLWHFESHGFYAATEIPGTINIIQTASANGALIPARLRIDQRTSKTDGETRRYAVPVIELPTLSTHTLMTGEIGGELGAGGLREIGAGAPVTAPEAAEVADAARQEQSAPPARRTQSPGEKLHRELGRMGFKDKTEHEELIYCASKGRTVHAAELDDTERAAVLSMADDVTQGRVTWAKIVEANDAHRAAEHDREAGKPLPGAGTGDGSKFRRAILTKAQRSGLDGDALHELALSVTGKPFDKIDSSEDANKLLEAV